jgi:hypothetical protein
MSTHWFYFQSAMVSQRKTNLLIPQTTTIRHSIMSRHHPLKMDHKGYMHFETPQHISFSRVIPCSSTHALMHDESPDMISPATFLASSMAMVNFRAFGCNLKSYFNDEKVNIVLTRGNW